MLKKVTTIIITIILIGLVFTNQKCYAICNTIRAKKEISAINLTLSNGQTLYDFEVKQSGISSGVLNPAQLQNTRSLDLIFLIDTDSSDLDAEKNIVKTAIDSFKNLYLDNGLSKLSVGIIGFNNNSMSSSEFSGQTLNIKNIASQESEIINELNNLNKNKNMNILQATELADTKLQSLRTNCSKTTSCFYNIRWNSNK